MTDNERKYRDQIYCKDATLRKYLKENRLVDPFDSRLWFDYLTEVKDILGNINNSIGFAATLLAKEYLSARFDLEVFDAGGKPQGAPGRDVDARTRSGETIHCELKTTRPYQPGFGASQKNEIKKDLSKLVASSANHKFMMVTNSDAYETLCKPSYAALTVGVEIVNLLTQQSYRH